MKIHFDCGVVEIELLDNNFVNSWKERVSPLKMNNTWNENLFPECRLSQEEILKIRTYRVDKFNAHVNELKEKYDLTFPGKMETLHMSQERLNLLHKWVTHGAFTRTNWDLPNASIADINNSKWSHWKDYDFRRDHEPEFSVRDEDAEDITRILFEMNCDIHWYEETITSPRVQQLKEWGYTYEDGRHIIQRYSTGKMEAFDVFEIPNEYRNFCTYDTDYDLWLPFAVLGKEYYTCWVNMDNPSQFDMTNIDKTYAPGWELQPNAFTVEVLKKREFQQWLTDYIVPTKPFCIGKIPLGRCTNKTQVDWNIVLQSPVKHVEW